MRKLRKLLFSRRKAHRVTAFSPSAGASKGAGAGRKRPPRRRVAKSKSTINFRAPFVAALRLAPYVAIAVVTAALPLVGYKVYLHMLTSPHFATRTIEVVGTERLQAATVIDASGLETGINILKVDEAEVEERLRWLPWVKKVSVRRRLPDTVVITIDERKAAALLVEKGTFLVDEGGFIFKEMEQTDYSPDLLVIAGLEASRLIKMGDERRVREVLTEALAIARDYGAMGLNRFYRVTEVHYSELLGFTLVCRGRQRFALGFGEYPDKLRRLANILVDLETRGSGVETVRLDNEKQPWKVAVGGSSVKLQGRIKGPRIPAMGAELLP